MWRGQVVRSADGDNDQTGGETPGRVCRGPNVENFTSGVSGR